jgi:ferredoxin
MLIMCAYCGHKLNHPLKDGITTCQHCERCFDSSPFHRLLSAFWLAKRRHYVDPSQLVGDFTEDEAAFVMAQIDEELTYEDFYKLVNEQGVSKIYVPKID